MPGSERPEDSRQHEFVKKFDDASEFAIADSNFITFYLKRLKWRILYICSDEYANKKNAGNLSCS